MSYPTLKEAREAASLSQQLARKMAINTAYISQRENGDRELSLLEMICAQQELDTQIEWPDHPYLRPGDIERVLAMISILCDHF